MTCAAARAARPAFTLIELLVAMAVVVTLATIALLVVPDALNQDRTVDGAGTVRQMLMIAKARAARDSGYRGVRLVVDSTTQYAVTAQYTEAPPVIVPNPSGSGSTTDPRVVFAYTVDSSGNLTARQCQLQNLSSAVANQINQNNGKNVLLTLPVLGTWHRVTGIASAPAESPTGSGRYTMSLNLDTWPDDQMGAGTSYATYDFGITAPPQPLIGEPPAQLPKNICVDLNSGVSNPSYNSSTMGTDYDIVFTPSGQVLPVGAGASAGGQIFLWVRDYTKIGGMTPTSTSPFAYDPTKQQFQKGGEQQIVALKTKSGSLGVFPALWPDATTGTYTGTNDPYSFARQDASSP